jgi:hypothetical protein
MVCVVTRAAQPTHQFLPVVVRVVRVEPVRLPIARLASRRLDHPAGSDHPPDVLMGRVLLRVLPLPLQDGSHGIAVLEVVVAGARLRVRLAGALAARGPRTPSRTEPPAATSDVARLREEGGLAVSTQTPGTVAF